MNAFSRQSQKNLNLLTRRIIFHNLVRFQINRHRYNRRPPIKPSNQIHGSNPIQLRHQDVLNKNSAQNMHCKKKKINNKYQIKLIFVTANPIYSHICCTPKYFQKFTACQNFSFNILKCFLPIRMEV